MTGDPMRTRTRELGQGLVEFAVIFPLLMFFLFAIFDVGLALNRRATMQHAVREGARYAATRDNADDGDFVKKRTVDQAQGLFDKTAVTICYDDLSGDDEQGKGDAVDVTAEYTYEPFILRVAVGWFGATVPAFDLGVTGSARLEGALKQDGADC